MRCKVVVGGKTDAGVQWQAGTLCSWSQQQRERWKEWHSGACLFWLMRADGSSLFPLPHSATSCW